MEWRTLDAARLSSLTRAESGDRWLKAVADAGAERLDADAPPHRAMSALYEAAWALAERDAQVTELRITDRFYVYAPPGAWLTVPVLYVVCIFLAAFQDDLSDRLLAFSALWGALGAAALGMLLWIGAATLAQRARKRALLDEARTQRDRAARAVMSARDTLLQKAFVVRVRGARFVSHVPRLHTIQTQLRRLPSHDQIYQALLTERDHIQAALTRHRQQPPAVWTDEGLRTS